MKVAPQEASKETLKVAFVHDWLVTFRGGEKVLEQLIRLDHHAPIYTLFYRPESMPDSIASRQVIAPVWSKPMLKLRKAMLPILPKAIEKLPTDSYDLLLSTSSCVAKGAIKGKHAKHICYLHSPMRYIWDQQAEYLKGVSHLPGAKTVIKGFTPYLRRWDVASCKQVDQFVVNSSFVQKRTQEFYHRDAIVIPPPVDIDRFVVAKDSSQRDDYFLAAGAWVSYKRFDLAIAACEKQKKRLVIAGGGPMEAQLRKMAGRYTEFINSPSDAEMTQLMQSARALLFPGVEDFGIIAIEAMAAGTPVIAFKKGGALDYIEPGRTGMFFTEATAESLARSIADFEQLTFDVTALRSFSEQFHSQEFLRRMQQVITSVTGESLAATN